MYDKENIYDEQIYPLMDKIINICKENNINMVSSFYLKEDDHLICTTYVPGEKENDKLIDAFNVLRNNYIAEKPYFAVMTIAKQQ